MTTTCSIDGSRKSGPSRIGSEGPLGHPRDQRLARIGIKQRRLALDGRPDAPQAPTASRTGLGGALHAPTSSEGDHFVEQLSRDHIRPVVGGERSGAHRSPL
jgi:hypothetical protein